MQAPNADIEESYPQYWKSKYCFLCNTLEFQKARPQNVHQNFHIDYPKIANFSPHAMSDKVQKARNLSHFIFV